MPRFRRSILPRLAPLLCALGALCLAPASKGDFYLIEFAESLAGQGPGGFWNIYSQPTNINGGVIRNSDNVASTITFSRSGNMNLSGSSGTASVYDNTAAVGNPSWVATTTNNLVAGDAFYTENGSTVGVIGQFTLTFSGLTAGSLISLDILASRNSGLGDGFYEFSLDNGATYQGFTVLNPDGTPTTTAGWSGSNTKIKSFDNQADGYTAHRYMNAADITLTGTTLRVRATDIDDTSGNFAIMNAMRLTVVPEPGSAVLLAAGAVLALGVRRRRS